MGAPTPKKARGQGGDASGGIGLRQVHTKLRRRGSVEKGGWDRTGVLDQDERGKEELDPGVKPFRDLAGECARGGPEGLYQGVREKYLLGFPVTFTRPSFTLYFSFL